MAHSSGDEKENVKSLPQLPVQRWRQRTTDKLWSEKLTWAFGSGELIWMWLQSKMAVYIQTTNSVVMLRKVRHSHT